MAEPRVVLHGLADPELEAALRDLGSALAYPAARPGPEIATRVRVTVADERLARGMGRAGVLPLRRLGRAGVLALAALLLLVALAVAAAIGVPGIRIVFAPGPGPTLGPTLSPGTTLPASPTPSVAVGATLGLGELATLDDAAAATGVEPLLPTDARIGPPDAVYLSHRRLTAAWAASSPALPALVGAPDVGLLLTEFRGHVDETFIEKQAFLDTRVEKVSVGGADGWWLSGAPHFFAYVDDRGNRIDETRRLVGSVLVWAADGVTYRLESPFDRDRTIAIAEALEPAR